MYATSSELWGSVDQRGKYAAKIYTIDGVLIYQEENGGTNAGKSPLGGVISQRSDALSMATTIANPITYYGSNAVINQTGHSGDLYNYYWTSYSRGTDGKGSPNDPLWHNVYLDGYIPLRVKSIYDPCPYLYRIPSNGTWNQFTNPGWTTWSYLGGVSWNLNTLGESWFSGLGLRNSNTESYRSVGDEGEQYSSTAGGQSHGYFIAFYNTQRTCVSYHESRSYGFTVRCIEDGLTFERDCHLATDTVKTQR